MACCGGIGDRSLVVTKAVRRRAYPEKQLRRELRFGRLATRAELLPRFFCVVLCSFFAILLLLESVLIVRVESASQSASEFRGTQRNAVPNSRCR